MGAIGNPRIGLRNLQDEVADSWNGARRQAGREPILGKMRGSMWRTGVHVLRAVEGHSSATPKCPPASEQTIRHSPAHRGILLWREKGMPHEPRQQCEVHDAKRKKPDTQR